MRKELIFVSVVWDSVSALEFFCVIYGINVSAFTVCVCVFVCSCVYLQLQREKAIISAAIIIIITVYKIYS